MACSSAGLIDAWRMAVPTAFKVAVQMSSRSCSTHPGLGKIWRNSTFAFAFTVRRWSRTSAVRSEKHTSELQSRLHLVCRLLLGKKNQHREQSVPGLNYAAEQQRLRANRILV